MIKERRLNRVIGNIHASIKLAQKNPLDFCGNHSAGQMKISKRTGKEPEELVSSANEDMTFVPVEISERSEVDVLKAKMQKPPEEY